MRISGCSTHRMLPNCDGDYACSGRRNGRPCFTRHSGALPAGAIYFDGEHWKVCLVGDGASEHGWNFSQRPLADDPVSLPPAGFWSAARASADDTPISYGGVRLEVLSAAGNHPIAGRFGLRTFSAGNIARRLRQQQQQQQRQQQQQAGGGCGATARRVRQPRPLPSARSKRVLSMSCLRWASAVDASTGREYYYHETTQESRWERPPSLTATGAEVTAQLFRVGPGSRI